MPQPNGGDTRRKKNKSSPQTPENPKPTHFRIKHRHVCGTLQQEKATVHNCTLKQLRPSSARQIPDCSAPSSVHLHHLNSLNNWKLHLKDSDLSSHTSLLSPALWTMTTAHPSFGGRAQTHKDRKKFLPETFHTRIESCDHSYQSTSINWPVH